MRNYWRPRGSRKAIRQFTLRDGLWIMAVIGATLLGILLVTHYVHGAMQ